MQLSKIKKAAQYLTPPLVWDLLKLFWVFLKKSKYYEWEYTALGWDAEKVNTDIKGWNVDSILNVYKSNWQNFLSNISKVSPLGISPESNSNERLNLTFHNIMMTYGYVLSMASRNKSSISVLDWGGGIGHYYVISKHLIPSLNIEYHCKDVPLLSNHGKEIFPEAYFYTDETCFNRKYDFVMASTSLQYSKDWIRVLRGLANSSSDYLFITRIPVVEKVASFVIIQRPYQYGYKTEYLGWCFNKYEFLNIAKSMNLHLVREFFAQESSFIYNAPEQPTYYGFLFQNL